MADPGRTLKVPNSEPETNRGTIESFAPRWGGVGLNDGPTMPLAARPQPSLRAGGGVPAPLQDRRTD